MMNYQEYSLAFHAAAQLVETGRHEKAISAFEELLANNIPDVVDILPRLKPLGFSDSNSDCIVEQMSNIA